jgi:ribonuclease Y
MWNMLGAAIGGLVIGSGIGYLVRQKLGVLRADGDEQQARQVLADARRDAESIRKDGQIRAKEDALKAREEFEKSTEARRKEIKVLEERVATREINLDRKVALLDRKEETLDTRGAELERRQGELDARIAAVEKVGEESARKLQAVAEMTRDQAREQLLEQVDMEIRSEAGARIRRVQEEARETSEREARKIITHAIQRFASAHTSDVVTSTVVLPSDDMKGRIIGRDGRNIRALEAATGMNVLIDDTPEAVVISGFDPVRREVARQSLERLIADGRIHPARIEEVVENTTKELNELMWNVGEETVYEVGLQGVEPELIRTLGRLRFRTSYSQNVLQHSKEVAQLMGLMAGDLGLDPQIAKRVGLFHDLGKALDHTVDGGHAIIGADLLKRNGESELVVNAVAAHHEDVAPESLYAVLCSAADAMSSSRVGARSQTGELYVKRLENLEEIADGFAGVEKSYAIQAGREVRVIVEPDKVDDNESMALARNISKKIESDLQYPGQIKVTVIRETRCVEYAK